MERTPTQIEDDDREAELMRKAEEFKETIRSAKAALDAEKSGDDSRASTHTTKEGVGSAQKEKEKIDPKDFEGPEFSEEKKKYDPVLRFIQEKLKLKLEEVSFTYKTTKSVELDPDNEGRFVGTFIKFDNYHDLLQFRNNLTEEARTRFDKYTWDDNGYNWSGITFRANGKKLWNRIEDPNDPLHEHETEFYELLEKVKTGELPDEYSLAVSEGEIQKKAQSEIVKKIKNLSQKDLGSLISGITNIGFQVERWKNHAFAKSYDWFSKTKDDKGNLVPKKGALANFLRARSKRHKLNAEVAETKITSAANTPKTSALSSAAYLTKNVVRLGGWIAAFTGAAPALGYRIAMTASVAAPGVAGDMKEARFRNEELLESTRIELEQAEEEAWAIYKKAGGEFTTDESGNINSTNSEEISSERLKKAYLEKMPEDLQKRLGISGLAESVFKTKMRKDVDDLSNQIQTIEKNSSLSPEQIKTQTSNLLKSWEEKLNDYDRALTQLGTVDQMAMGLRNLETGAKYFLRGMTAYTLVLSAEKAWDMFSHWSNGHITDQTESLQSAGRAAKNGIKVLGNKAESPATTPSPLGQHPENAQTNIGTTPGVQTEVTSTPPAGATHETVASATSTPAEQVQGAVKKAAGQIAETSATPAPEVSNVEITGPTDPAVVQQGKGIEHVFIKQIKGNPEIAKALGIKDGEDIHKFAGRMAHRIARDNGYVDKNTGEEIYVRKAGEVAYKLIPSGNTEHPFNVQEFQKGENGFTPTHTNKFGDAFEGDKADSYEMRHAKKVLPADKTPEVPATPTETPAQSAVYDQNRLATPEEIQQNLKNLGFTGGQTEDEILEHAKSIGYHNPGDAKTGAELYKKIEDALDSASQTTAPKTETVSEMLPIFKENIYNLQTPILRTINEIHLTNLKKLFPENMVGFRTSLEKIKFDEFNETFNPNGQVAQYIKTLQKITGEKPKMGIFGLFNKETVGHYLARALQYAGTKPGMLDKLKL